MTTSKEIRPGKGCGGINKMRGGIKTTCIQWNPSITDTFGTPNFVCHNEVSLSQGFPVYFR